MEVGKVKLVEQYSCEKNSNVCEIAKIMKEKGERHIIVVENQNPVGIVSAVDIVNKVVAEGKDANNETAEGIMTAPIISIDSNDNIVKAYFTMVGKNLFSCPVTEDSKLIGVLTMQEALKYIKESKERSDKNGN